MLDRLAHMRVTFHAQSRQQPDPAFDELGERMCAASTYLRNHALHEPISKK
jgi:hypothetical protein